MDQITPESRSKANPQIIAEYFKDFPVIQVSGSREALISLWASIAAVIADPGVIVGPYMLSPFEMAIKFLEAQEVLTCASSDVEGDLGCWLDLSNRLAPCLNMTPEQMAQKIIDSQGTKEAEDHNT